MASLRWCVFALLTWIVLSAAACGPPELPAFANPPDPDSGSADEDDAGTLDGGNE